MTNTIRYINTLLLLSTFLIGSNLEFTIFENAGISIEIFLLFISFSLNLFILKSYSKSLFSILFFFSLFILLLFTIYISRDLIIGNFRTFYSIIFYLLLYSLITIRYQPPFYLNQFLILLSFYMMLKALIFPEVFEDLDFLDSSDGRIHRLRVLGFESNAVGVIFCAIIIYSYSFLETSNKLVSKIIYFLILIFSLILLIKTFGRAAYLSLIFSLILIFYKKIKFYLILVPIIFIIIYLLISYDLFSPLIFERLANSFETNNPRVANWIIAINDFKSDYPFSIFYGIGFFKHAIDNTYISLFISYGIIGFLIFFYLFFKINKHIIKSKYSKIILIVLLFNFFFVDFFAQRKILLIAFFLITSLEIEYSQRNNKLIF
jgi:hypothetical protein